MILRDSKDRLSADAFQALTGLTVQLSSADSEIEKLEARIRKWHRRDATSRRLITIPGVGPITASAISASVPDASLFRSGRQFAAWLGLTPRANSSGGKERLMGITKKGDGYLRRLLVVGATAVLRHARKGNPGKKWAIRLLERKRPKVVAVALANKTARIAWALLLRNEVYVAPMA
jgi:transposase